MEKIYTWKRGFFKRTYELFSNEMAVGTLRERTWSYSADGEINGKTYQFIITGFWKRKTEISDTEKVIATITYNSWMTKATIEFTGSMKSLTWQYDNFWHTWWSLSDPSGRKIKYHGSQLKGEITSNIDDDMLILAGLFITSYYRREASGASAVTT